MMQEIDENEVWNRGWAYQGQDEVVKAAKLENAYGLCSPALISSAIELEISLRKRSQGRHNPAAAQLNYDEFKRFSILNTPKNVDISHDGQKIYVLGI